MIKQRDLKEVRERHGLTQTDMAELLGVCRRSYQHYEYRTIKMRDEQLKLLSFKLNKK